MNFGKIDKYILFGGGELLCWVANRLKEKEIPVLVVTSSRHISERESFFSHKKIPFIIADNIEHNSDVLSAITDSTLAISLGAAWIFKQPFIDLFHGRFINSHGSKLPQNRGGGGFSWRIMRDDRSGFCLLHCMEAGVDTGDIVFYEEYVYPSSCRHPIDYNQYTIQQYQTFMERFFELVSQRANFDAKPQQEYFSNYWPRLATDVHGYIDWSWSAKHIEMFICAFDEPYAGASTFLNGKRVWLKNCWFTCCDGTFHPFQDGIIYRKSHNAVYVAKQEGALMIEKILDADGKDALEELKVGDRFFTPSKQLEYAKSARVIYTPEGLKEEK